LLPPAKLGMDPGSTSIDATSTCSLTRNASARPGWIGNVMVTQFFYYSSIWSHVSCQQKRQYARFGLRQRILGVVPWPSPE